MADAPALLQQRPETDALLAARGGKIQRRGSNGETRRLDAEVAGNQAVGHLIVAPAADAVDELVGQ